MKITVTDTHVHVAFGPAPPPPPDFSVKGIGIGAPAIIAAEPLQSDYAITIQGKTDADISAEVGRLQTRILGKSARHDAFASMISTTLTIAGATFTITDVALRDHGIDLELYVNVVDAKGQRLNSMPLEAVYGSVADVPDNAGILAMLIDKIAGEQTKTLSRANQVARLKVMLGTSTDGRV